MICPKFLISGNFRKKITYLLLYRLFVYKFLPLIAFQNAKEIIIHFQQVRIQRLHRMN